MRTITAAAITDTVARLCIQANTHLPEDIVAALDRRRKEEPWPLAKGTLGLLWDNLELAEREELLQGELPFSVSVLIYDLRCPTVL